MKTYTITFCIEMLKDFEVKADSHADAVDKAYERLAKWTHTKSARKLKLGDAEFFCSDPIE